jgi:hypothetical protein
VAGTSNGQRLVVYEPRVGGRIEMEVSWDGEQGGFEHVGAEHAGYETDWGMTQLNALREVLATR